jgi:tetratricopeptide (TPR) repeat protein
MLASAYLCAYASSSWMGNISDALNYTGLSIDLCKKNKQLIDMEAFSHLYQGFAYLFKGDYDLAKESLNMSREIEERLGGGYYYIASFRYFVSGLLYYALGDWKNLKIEADELINMQRYIDGSLLHFADIYYGLIAEEKGDYSNALQKIKKAVDEFEKLEFGIVLPMAYRSLGELCIKMGRIDEALDAIQRGIDCAEESNQKIELVALKAVKAAVHAECKNWEKAVEELKVCDLKAEELGLIPTSAKVKEVWGRFYLLKAEKTPNERSSLLKKAVDSYNRSLELWEQVDNPRQVNIVARELKKIGELSI